MTTILAAIVGGLLAISGQLVMRLLREWGDIRVRVGAWEVTYPEGVNTGGTKVINVAVPGYYPYHKEPDKYRTVTASYSLHLELFNEKDLGTALQGIGVVFYKDNEVAAEGDLMPTDARSRVNHVVVGSHAGSTEPRRAEELLPEPPATVDLPSRRTTRLTLSGEISGESGLEVMRSTRAALKGYFPNNAPFLKDIAVLEETSEHGDKWRLLREEPRGRLRRFFPPTPRSTLDTR